MGSGDNYCPRCGKPVREYAMHVGHCKGCCTSECKGEKS